MKILVINTVPTDKNGITNVIFNYLKAMGNDVAFDYVAINNPDAFYVNFLEEKGAALYSLKRKNVLRYIWSLCKIIKKNKYDAIHVHGNSHTVVLELLAAKLAGCKVTIIHAHSTGCNSVALHKLLAGLFDSLCTDCLACGEEAGKFMFGNKPFRQILISGILRSPIYLQMIIMMTLVTYYYTNNNLMNVIVTNENGDFAGINFKMLLGVLAVAAGLFIGQFVTMGITPVLIKKIEKKTLYNFYSVAYRINKT